FGSLLEHVVYFARLARPRLGALLGRCGPQPHDVDWLGRKLVPSQKPGRNVSLFCDRGIISTQETCEVLNDPTSWHVFSTGLLIPALVIRLWSDSKHVKTQA